MLAPANMVLVFFFLTHLVGGFSFVIEWYFFYGAGVFLCIHDFSLFSCVFLDLLTNWQSALETMRCKC